MNLSQYFVRTARVTEYFVTGFSWCSYIYGEFTCFHFWTFVCQTLGEIREIVKFIRFFLFL